MKRIWKYISLAIFAVNLLTIFYLWLGLDVDNCNCQNELVLNHNLETMLDNFVTNHTHLTSDSVKKLNQLITVIVREFELFENDIIDTVKSVLEVDKDLSILVISDASPYPPIHLHLTKEFPNSRVTAVSLHTYPYQSVNKSDPRRFIHTPYTLFIPDAVKIDAPHIHEMIKEHDTHPDVVIASVVGLRSVKCLSMRINLREWTLKYNAVSQQNNCDVLEGNHVLLMPTKLLFELNNPFARPFPYAVYLQTAFRNIKVHLVPDFTFEQKKQLFIDPHNKWKYNNLVSQRLTNLYKDWGIKKVIHGDGKIDWYGCTKTSTRCFGTVIRDMPEYLYEGRWTPPCCLKNLRETAKHVFRILEKCGVRYWLEGGSLLGAIRTGDIIPWDYDVDIGIYKDDIPKCEWLKNSEQQSIIDNKGYVWEKATEGDFIRVQFSQSNHLHVDIFPFYSVKGIMTKHTWFTTHKQDTEFPEHYLKPLTKIKFIGVLAYAPNNVKKFLEMKFGKNVIETPEYPDPKMLKFSKS